MPLVLLTSLNLRITKEGTGVLGNKNSNFILAKRKYLNIMMNSVFKIYHQTILLWNIWEKYRIQFIVNQVTKSRKWDDITFFATIRFLFRSDSRRNSIDKLEEQCTLSPESTTNTRDSGIESIANRLSEDRNFGSSLSSSPEPRTTGNDQVDQSLLWHLSYCDRLVEVSHFVLNVMNHFRYLSRIVACFSMIKWTELRI